MEIRVNGDVVWESEEDSPKIAAASITTSMGELAKLNGEYDIDIQIQRHTGNLHLSEVEDAQREFTRERRMKDNPPVEDEETETDPFADFSGEGRANLPTGDTISTGPTQ